MGTKSSGSGESRVVTPSRLLTVFLLAAVGALVAVDPSPLAFSVVGAIGFLYLASHFQPSDETPGEPRYQRRRRGGR